MVELSSSVSGIIGTIDVDRSDSVDKDQVVAKLRSDVLRIAQLDPLRVEVIVPVGKFGTISTGMRAEVTPELARKRKYIAEVSIDNKVVDAASSTFGVRLELPNPGNYIPGGLR